MKIYNWTGYDFVGTATEFAKRFGICKSKTFVNAIKRVPRHTYNCMDAREQAEYEKKRERVKPAYRLYLNEERTHSVIITKEEYQAIDLPEVLEEFQTFKLRYRNRFLSTSFTGNGHDEIPVASAMLKYKAEAMPFAEQVMLATGYFNTNQPVEKPKAKISHTSLRLSYSNGIEMLFVSEYGCGGVCNCYLQLITLNGKQIYNGCFRRHASVEAVMQATHMNQECKDAHCYFG